MSNSRKRLNSRSKGKRGELELAHFLTDAGFPATRGRDQGAGGEGRPDIRCDALHGLHIECKRTEGGNLYKWLEQSEHDAPDGATPVVCHRRSDRDWVVIFYLTDLLDLVN